MKALLYKEFKLAMHPVCYVFMFAFPLMILIPSYPIGVGFIYILSCYPILFLGANKGQQSNDLLFSTLLPVRKKDIVMARILTVITMQTIFMLIMSALAPLSAFFQSSMTAAAAAAGEKGPETPGLGLDAFVSVLAIAIVGFSVADLIFFPIYYNRGRSIVMSTLLSILGFAVYIMTFTLVLPLVFDGYRAFFSANIGVQFAILGVSLLISFCAHFAVYKISSKRLEQVDF